ncbi:nuclear pore complex protein Nup50 [Battus philenor]|uniref:nuclear pore complex protein Nup50 n=1 Tax=Battus philenor TaxID=42288 RepID=UPI0035CE9F3E
MSIKRRATTDLNHDNWDQEEQDQEEMGSFRTASEDILEKRVIKTAKRRFQNVEETKKPVFSGFSGFNKSQPSSFDFLANLTNGNKSNTSSPVTTESATSKPFGNISTSSIFTSSPLTSVTKPTFGKIPTESTSVFGTTSSTASTSVFGVTTSTGTASVFGTPVSTTATSVFGTPNTTAVTSVFGTQTSVLTSVFGTSSSTTAPSVFGAPTTATKADSTVNENPFKSQITSTLVPNSFNTKSPEVSSSKVSSTIFGVASSSSNTNKSQVTSSKSTAFQIKPTTSALQTTNMAPNKSEVKTKESIQNTEKGQSKKLIYYGKLKGLNESVSEWIKKHVEETPLCILTPIFKDYEAYLKEIQDEYENKKDKIEPTEETSSKKNPDPSPLIKSPSTVNNLITSPTTATNTQKSIFDTTGKTTQSPNFSFGFTSSPSTNTTSSGFSFGVSSTQSTSTTTSPFAISKSASATNGKSPFSFGNDKPFSFNANVQLQSNTEKTSEKTEEDDEPPKVEFTPVIEENSIFDKRCKIFVKKDGNFVDKGVGTLYIKKIQDSEKHQLLVRANTNLGSVLLNLVLSSAIPTQRMGKNNVMLVCIPNPDAKPPPVPILIRVKTSEEADELLKTLDKYKA